LVALSSLFVFSVFVVFSLAVVMVFFLLCFVVRFSVCGLFALVFGHFVGLGVFHRVGFYFVLLSFAFGVGCWPCVSGLVLYLLWRSFRGR
jgi:hypothetical protein